jgi:hypothetical protein
MLGWTIIRFVWLKYRWRHVCILSLMSCVIPIAAYLMVGLCLLFSTSSHKVLCPPYVCDVHKMGSIWASASFFLFYIPIVITGDGLDRIKRSNTRYSTALNPWTCKEAESGSCTVRGRAWSLPLTPICLLSCFSTSLWLIVLVEGLV